MYIVLNHKLNTYKNECDDFYEVSFDKDKNIISDMFDINQLSSILDESYELGDDIYVYCIDENSLGVVQDEIDNTITYKFKVKSLVEFSILKENSKQHNKNQFMLYKFCSTISKLISNNNWNQCIARLTEDLDFYQLLRVYKYLKYYPKGLNSKNHIEYALEKIKFSIILKSFEVEHINLEDIICIVNGDEEHYHLIISSIKQHIYSQSTDIATIENDVTLLTSLQSSNILSLVYRDYINQLLLIYTYSVDDRKNLFKKTLELASLIFKHLDITLEDSIYMEEQFALLLNNKKIQFF